MNPRRTEADEQTPLLRTDQKRKHSPVPWGQFSTIIVLQFARALALTAIYPFAPELVRNIGITHGDETRVAYYVGLMQSIFYAAEAMTVLFWSRVSDHLGRRPIIMTGLLANSVSMYCFGLSRTFWGLVVSGSLNGVLNGNIGVVKSMLAEIADPSNIAQASALMLVALSVGSAIGSVIGGSLSRPAERFPSVFGEYEFLKRYPYFLPCSIPAALSALACVITFLYLKETVPNPLSLRQLLCRSSKSATIEGDVPQRPTTVAVDDSSCPLSIHRLLVSRVVIAAGNYAFFAVIDIALRAVQPVFQSTPIELGGLGLDPQQIGLILSLTGILSGTLQICFFSKVHDRFGTKCTYLVGIVSYFPVFGLFPLINELARRQGLSAVVWSLVIGQALMSVVAAFSFGCVFLFVTASSPNKASLGTVNGMAQMLVSIVRMVGPVMANSLFSLSIDQEHHYMGGYLVYYVLAAITCVAFYMGTLLPDEKMSDEALPEEL